MIVAWNLVSLGRVEDAEPAARSSLERFDAEGEVLVVVSSLNALAGIAEARGDVDAASAAYEALLERCRATGQPLQVPFSLVALAALRARQGDDAAADGLYQEAIGCSVNPWLPADAMVGQAAAARRLGDLARARALLDAAASRYRRVDLPAGQPRVLAGLAWWALAAGHPDDATVFAADAAKGATASGDPATQLLADTWPRSRWSPSRPAATSTPLSRSFSSAPGGRRIALSPMSQMWPRSRPAWRCPLTERPGQRQPSPRGGLRRAPAGVGGAIFGEPHPEALATTCSQLTSAPPQRHLSAPGQPCRHAADAGREPQPP